MFILFMMVTFSATLYLVFGREKGWILIPVGALACMPVTSFVMMQFPLNLSMRNLVQFPVKNLMGLSMRNLLQLPLLIDVISNTYFLGIFRRYMERISCAIFHEE
ncbi:ankyrin repeat-containing protein [Striga asiatica]|uniref:Ankyrin repeat-containing protein n=1 Tax=Striga asiatica TaxID=4170 RepID=A0A5A7PT76_STRAF|nr:ankyrin repeat-containing protein [Striga asiatica]